MLAEVEGTGTVRIRAMEALRSFVRRSAWDGIVEVVRRTGEKDEQQRALVG